MKSRLVVLAPVLALSITVATAAARRVLSGAKPPSIAQAQSQLESLIENVPPVSSGRVSYGTSDNAGDPTTILNVIPDPRGGYLGVYDFAPGPQILENFSVALGHSWDLIHWRQLRILDAPANSPTLRPIPGTHSYLLADEHYSPVSGDRVRVR